MSSVDYIKIDEQFTQQANDRVIYQFQDSPIFKKLVSVSAERYNGLQRPCVELIDERLLETAVGVHLDELGALLKVYRRGDQGDEEYRSAIRLYAASLTNSGTRDEIVSILKQQAADEDVHIYLGTRRYISLNVFRQCGADITDGQNIANLFTVGADLRIASRGGGYNLGFQGSKFIESVRGFGDKGFIVVENCLNHDFSTTDNWNLVGSEVEISGGTLNFTSTTADNTATPVGIADGEYTCVIDVTSLTAGILKFVNGEGYETELSAGINIVCGNRSGVDFYLKAETGTTASITSFNVQTYEVPDVVSIEQGRLSKLIFQSGYYGDND